MTRNLLSATAAVATLTLGTALPAEASSSYQKSRDACTQAITQQLGTDARFNLDKIRSRARYRDYRFTVRTDADQRIEAECRARDTGEVLALTINGAEQMVAGN